MKTKQKMPKERNPFVQHLINRPSAGAHTKSKKIVRKELKLQLKKELENA
jgi:hypothetical protein